MWLFVLDITCVTLVQPRQPSLSLLHQPYSELSSHGEYPRQVKPATTHITKGLPLPSNKGCRLARVCHITTQPWATELATSSTTQQELHHHHLNCDPQKRMTILPLPSLRNVGTYRRGADASKGGRHIDGGQTCRKGADVLKGARRIDWGQAWQRGGCISSGMGVSMVGWAYWWRDGHIDSGIGCRQQDGRIDGGMCVLMAG